MTGFELALEATTNWATTTAHSTLLYEPLSRKFGTFALCLFWHSSSLGGLGHKQGMLTIYFKEVNIIVSAHWKMILQTIVPSNNISSIRKLGNCWFQSFVLVWLVSVVFCSDVIVTLWSDVCNESIMNIKYNSGYVH